MNRQRRTYSRNERQALLRQHIDEGRPIRQIAAVHKIHPTILYRWKRQLLNRPSGHASSGPPESATNQRKRVAALRMKVDRLCRELDDLERGMKR